MQTGFDSLHVTYALIKTVVFAVIIATVSAYQGYYTRGGTREVGISSTKAVVYSNVVILIANYLLTQIPPDMIEVRGAQQALRDRGGAARTSVPCSQGQGEPDHR
jgi:hypothetical protein